MQKISAFAKGHRFALSRKISLINWLFIMRLSVCFAALFAVSVSLIAATPSSGQNIMQTRVSLAIRNETLKSALRKLQDASGYSIFYSSTTIDLNKRVDLTNDNVTVTDALDILLAGTGYGSRQQGNSIIILPAKIINAQQIAPRLLVGMVTDENGDPLPGVTVRLKKNTRISTATDQNGHFHLDITNDDDDVIFSFVGYQTQTYPLRSLVTGFKIKMQPTNGNLNEVQVIGYGTTTRRISTGTVASITAAEIEKQPVSNPLAALAGRMSGVLVGQNNGVPGSAVQIQIRGQNTLSSGGIPLYVIDGVPFTNFNGGSPATDNLNAFTISGASAGISPFSMINPSDIERIDILKDADATSIYGSRGANGVVLITTKHGKPGKVKVNLNLNSGFSEVGRMIPVLDLQQYLTLRREAFKNDGVTPNATNAPDLTVWDQNNGTDFQKLLIGNRGAINELQGSMAGGTEQTRFFFNSAYRREGTVYLGNFADKRFSSRLNLDHNSVNKKFGASFSVSYTVDNTNIPTSDLTSSYNLPPNLPLYTADGQLNFVTGFTNPFSTLLKTYKGNTNNLIANANLKYTILPGLTVKSNFGYTNNHLEQVNTNPASSQNPASSPTSSANFAFTTAQNWIIEPTADYTKTIGDGKLTALVGTSYQQNSSNGLSLAGTGYSNEALLGTLGAAGTTTVNYNNIVKYKYDAVFARLNYDWQEKYLINGTFRRDGSSRFGPQNRFGNFGAVGLGWVFSKEDFLKKQSFLSFGKLRGSYGTTGNDQISNYIYLPLYSSASTYLGNAAMNVVTLPNQDIRWETTRKLEFAIDLSFFNDRIGLTANYYRNRSSDLIASNALPTQAGYNSYTLNLPAVVQNKGLELELTTTNIRSKDFTWKTLANISFVNNKLIAFPGLEQSFYASSYVVGQSINLIRLYHYTGVNPTNGTATYEDRDKNGVIDANDRYIADLGTPYYGGFNNTFSYKGFELGIFLQFNHRFGATQILNTRPGAFVNQNTYWLGRWTPDNSTSNIPAATANAGTPIYTSYNNYTSSDAVYGNASFIKLRSVNLTYTVPSIWAKKLGMSTCSVFAEGQNLYMWANNKYILDTETQISGGPSGLGTGTLGQVLPPLRTIVFGLNCSF